MRAGLLIYDGVEPIEMAICGVLSMARRIAPQIGMFTVAERPGPVQLVNGLTVIAQHGYDDSPDADVLIVCGGPGWVAQAENAATLDFLRRQSGPGLLASVCTGALVLAASGRLNGHRATTKRHYAAGETSPLELLRQRHPAIDVVEARVVDEGRVLTGGGVALCIDATLYLIERFLGRSVAEETARIMDYQTAWHANERALPVLAA